MSISHYIKEIGRGKHGSRSISRDQANDLMGKILDGEVSDLELGAFCIAMRIKGETPAEMAGFLDAVHLRLLKVQNGAYPTIVLPSYNGARKLPVLTPLLALLLAKAGLAVVVHGSQSEDKRIASESVFAHLGIMPSSGRVDVCPGEVVFVRTSTLNFGLEKLLCARKQIGLRNSAHSLVKLMNPCANQATIVSSYTHPEYLASMTQTFRLTRQTALLIRGTEGEPVADLRRTPAMDWFQDGMTSRIQEQQEGSLINIPEIPSCDAMATAQFIQETLGGERAVPKPIERQLHHLLTYAK